jgi:hypothetical protein
MSMSTVVLNSPIVNHGNICIAWRATATNHRDAHIEKWRNTMPFYLACPGIAFALASAELRPYA